MPDQERTVACLLQLHAQNQGAVASPGPRPSRTSAEGVNMSHSWDDPESQGLIHMDEVQGRVIRTPNRHPVAPISFLKKSQEKKKRKEEKGKEGTNRKEGEERNRM